MMSDELARKLVQCCMLTLVWDDEDVLQHVWSYEPYALCIVYPFDADQACCTNT
jgi:hypothetical protein